MTDPATLARANLMYRRPDLYDQLTTGDEQAAQVASAVAELAGPVASVLDLGCGTGRDLDIFRVHYGWDGTGIEFQPELVTYAQLVRPDLNIRLGDMRTVRLGRKFDLITCLGNSLAYLHTDAELQAAAETFAAHAHANTLLIINTLTAPPPSGEVMHSTCRIDDADAQVSVAGAWDADSKLHTTHRDWSFPDGSAASDTIIRRVTPPAEIARILRAHGFALVPAGPFVCAVHRRPREADPTPSGGRCP
ncbi:hypothetical protein GCM10023321_53420 [Pseudonocardia eucalypti]|uniref:Methyltransferase family protein n=1 Tax=Pseudonocardia eucalypti TaxID=648755 RepID=A0ABP9QN39_9PSEU|nr:SAM-dependent methyltransferase [Pseudonocardia eucalypti]